MNNRYRYSFWAKYRGLTLSLLWGLFLLLLILFNDEFKDRILSFSILFGSLLFLALHYFWDIKIFSNHKDIDLNDSGIVFLNKDGSGRELLFSDIVDAETFPTKDSPYDDDFVGNMMSSGLRIVSRDKDKYLIFNKIKGFRQLKQELLDKGIKIRE